jgi:hypothetical protein
LSDRRRGRGGSSCSNVHGGGWQWGHVPPLLGGARLDDKALLVELHLIESRILLRKR